MTTKDLIIQELDRLPEDRLPELLEMIRQLQEVEDGDEAWQAYLEIEQEDDAVFKRLANA